MGEPDGRMHIIDLPADDQELIQQAAILLVEGFKEHWPNAWPDMDTALGEVRRCLGPGRINRVAVDDDGTLLGWVGASREYQGHAWELHPLVVHPDRQGRGIGRALVADLEARVRGIGRLRHKELTINPEVVRFDLSGTF